MAETFFHKLPESGMTDYMITLNDAMSEATGRFIPDMFLTHFFLTNPLFILLIFLSLIIAVALFFDFFVGAWKIPIAMAVDLLDLVAVLNPGVLDWIAGAGGVMVFYLLVHEPQWAKHGFGWIGGVKCVIPYGPVSVLPINTLLMFAVTILD